MVYVSEVITTPPAVFHTPLQEAVYSTLQLLQIPFHRVDNDPAITMEDCIAIDERLQVKTVKTLLLCNRQQTSFYLFVTPGDKPFRSKDFSHALEISRVSFATEDHLQQFLGTEIGATTIFSVLLRSARDVRIVFDSQVLEDPLYGCTDGTTTGYMRVATADILHKLLPHAGREYTVITV